MALGRPDAVAKYQLAMLIGMAVAILPAINRWGLAGAAGTITIVTLTIHPFRYVLLGRILGVRAARLYGALAIPLGATAIMAVITLGALRYATSGGLPPSLRLPSASWRVPRRMLSHFGCLTPSLAGDSCVRSHP
jgi:hypothetical protein